MCIRFLCGFLFFTFCALPGMAGAADQAGNMKVAKLYHDPFLLKKPDTRLEINENYKYYDINGSSPAELRRQMSRNGTRWNDGKVYAALTTWDVSYNYDVELENGRYRIKSATIDLNIVYRFPRWDTESSAPKGVAEAWDGYMDHLKVHEFGHRDLAVKAAADLKDAIASLGSFGSRNELDEEAERLIHTKLDQLNRTQREYDEETRHGKTQGAVFPAA